MVARHQKLKTRGVLRAAVASLRMTAFSFLPKITHEKIHRGGIVFHSSRMELFLGDYNSLSRMKTWDDQREISRIVESAECIEKAVRCQPGLSRTKDVAARDAASAQRDRRVGDESDGMEPVSVEWKAVLNTSSGMPL